MKTLEEIKAWLLDGGYDDTVVLEDPDYATAFIGVSDEGRAIYDYDLMIDFLVEKEGMADYMEAADFLSYNTLRAIPYFGDQRPIVMYRSEEYEAQENA